MKSQYYSFAAALALATGSLMAQTPCVTLNMSTGQPGWRLMSGPGVTPGQTPVDVSPYAGWWTIPGASWVSVDAKRGNASGDYVYELRFNICDCDRPNQLDLKFFADNAAEVKLNGNTVINLTGNNNFTGQVKSLVYNGSFQATNVLRLTVKNESLVTGLIASLKVTGAVLTGSGGMCPGCMMSSATGQPGWVLASGPGVTVPKAPVTVPAYPGWGSVRQRHGPFSPAEVGRCHGRPLPGNSAIGRRSGSAIAQAHGIALTGALPRLTQAGKGLSIMLDGSAIGGKQLFAKFD